MGKERTCVICGKKFVQPTEIKRMKYCSDECRIHARAMHMRDKRRRDSDKRAAAKSMKNITTGILDERLAEARARGMSYSEYQQQKTIEMIRRGEL